MDLPDDGGGGFTGVMVVLRRDFLDDVEWRWDSSSDELVDGGGVLRLFRDMVEAADCDDVIAILLVRMLRRLP